MKTLLVANDGSTASTHAWRWAHAVATAAGAHVVVQPGVAVDAVLDAAERADADLVVVAAHPEELTDGLAHHSRRPFAVVPTTAECRAPARVAVGWDGSPGAEEAAWWCAVNGAALGAEIVAVDVVNPPQFLASHLAELHDDAEEEVESRYLRRLAETGVRARADVLDDPHPAHALLAAAGRDGADVVVIGARALVGLRLLPSDGVTLYALHHSPLPVIVVPAREPVKTVRDGGSESGFVAERVVG